MSGVQRGYGYQYETVAAGQTVTLGLVGAPGDYVHRLIVTVNTPATSTVTLYDNAVGIPIVPANVSVGVLDIELNMASGFGGWEVTTGAGVTVVAVGLFS
jgi:hypothetical protein